MRLNTTKFLLPLVGALLTVGLLLVPVRVSAAAQDDSVTVPTQAESWYRSIATVTSAVPDTCDLPVGCLPAAPGLPVEPPSPYPAGFLHVGVGAGIEESRTYLAFDLAEVPFDAELAGGTISLPITTDPTAGVARPEAAKVRACNVPSFVGDNGAGDLTGAPNVDCAISSPAVYVAATGTEPAALTVDLTPFLDEWSTGVAQVALVPQEGLAPTDTWHVAFSRRDRQAADALPISARLELTVAESGIEPFDEPPAPDIPPLLVDDDDAPVLFTEQAFAEPSLESESFAAPPIEQAVVEQSGNARVARPVVSVIGGRFAYPAIFLLPLAVGAAIAWAGRAFTRDLQAPVG